MEFLAALPLALSVCLLCILSLVHVDAQNRVNEVQVLTRFKKALDVPRNVDYGPSYWFTWDETDENTCNWVGVRCTINFTVGALDLSGWYLWTLDSVEVLSHLPDLRELYMSGTFTVDFPEDIGNLTHLTRLDLSKNYFLTAIPQSISACRSLQYLSLENSDLFGAIPDLSALVNLQFLLLAGNDLSGPFPDELGKLSSLVLIDLSSNSFNGSIPSLVNSTNLVNLTLDNNFFTEFDESFHMNAPNLQYLQVAGNLLEGSIPLGITNLQNVTTIDLSGNRLSGNIPANMTKLLRVTYIDLSGNRFSGNIPPGFSNLMSHQAFTLDLSQNELSGSIPLDLVQVQPSYHNVLINVSFNHLNGSIPAPTIFKNRTSDDTLWLDLSHNQLEGPVPSQLSGWALMDLHDNLLSGNIVDVLAETQAFRSSCLGGAYTQFYLGNNLFTGDLTEITFHWANWSALVLIDLSNNNLSWRPTQSIHDPVGAALDNFPISLSYFYVSGNNFWGTFLPVAHLPCVNGNLGSLYQLDLSDTQLAGNISGEVFNSTCLPNLHLLNLSNNLITGPVPQGITTFPRTVFHQSVIIDLSNNSLSGQLPVIPSNSSLADPGSLAGNTGLCGGPGFVDCELFQAPPPQQRGVEWWIVMLIVGGSVTMGVGSCLVGTWRWRAYRRKHRQDADLIRTLMERELVTLMPLRYLRKVTNGFSETARIGEGGFGTVYRGNLNDGTTVAIKRSKHAGTENDKGQFLNEVRILSQVNHRHLVKLLGCCMENKVALLVYEFVSNGTLQEHLQGRVGGGRLSWKQRLTIAVQTADALNYLHSAAASPIYHRDVKSANILLTDDFSAKVADFGISKLVRTAEASHIPTALQGTMGYIDPDYWTSFQLTDKSDVYSFGVVLLELIAAKPAVDSQRGGKESSLVFFGIPHLKSGDIKPLIVPALMGTYSEQDGRGRESILSLGRLAMKCLDMRSEARPSMNEVSKELLILWFELAGTSMKETLVCMNEEEKDNAERQVVALSHILSWDSSWTSQVQREARSLELPQVSRVPTLGSRMTR